MRISDWSSDVCSSDLDGLKAALPKGAQVARENVERAVSTGQEVFGRTLKANEAIAQIAKAQVESTTAKVQAKAEEAVQGATKASRKSSAPSAGNPATRSLSRVQTRPRKLPGFFVRSPPLRWR